jgi:hypothetical protein
MAVDAGSRFGVSRCGSRQGRQSLVGRQAFPKRFANFGNESKVAEAMLAVRDHFRDLPAGTFRLKILVPDLKSKGGTQIISPAFEIPRSSLLAPPQIHGMVEKSPSWHRNPDRLCRPRYRPHERHIAEAAWSERFAEMAGSVYGGGLVLIWALARTLGRKSAPARP